jgi:hypothetical protein
VYRRFFEPWGDLGRLPSAVFGRLPVSSAGAPRRSDVVVFN